MKTCLILQYSTFKSTVGQYSSWHTGAGVLVCIFESLKLEGLCVGDLLYLDNTWNAKVGIEVFLVNKWPNQLTHSEKRISAAIWRLDQRKWKDKDRCRKNI